MSDELHTAFIALGSNLEPRRERVDKAIESLRGLGEIVNVSSIYNTAPMGYREQPEFLNAVLEMKTHLTPLRMLKKMRAIELELGRQERPRWHEREIDLDLLFWDDFVLKESALTLPHPGIAERKFVLEPLAEIAPNFVHPKSGKTIARMLEELLRNEKPDTEMK